MYLNNNSLILHIPGPYKIKRGFDKLNSEVELSSIDNLAIVTFIYKLKESKLQNQLNSNNVSYNYLKHEELKHWTNYQKIKDVIEILENIKEEYSLILDANDTVVLDDFNNILDRYKEFDCDILFSKGKDISEKRCGLTDVNSGVLIGKTKSILNFYKHVSSLEKKYHKLFFNTNFRYSDEMRINLALKENKHGLNIKIDTTETLFRTLSQKEYIEVIDKEIIIKEQDAK